MEGGPIGWHGQGAGAHVQGEGTGPSKFKITLKREHQFFQDASLLTLSPQNLQQPSSL